MRKWMVWGLVLLLAGCGESLPTSVADDESGVDDAAVAWTASLLTPSADGPDIRRLKALPAAIALTAAQEAAITKLIDDFQAAYEADIEKLADLQAQVRAGLAAGKTKAELAPLFQEMRPLRQRVSEAAGKLQEDIQAVLTAEQKAWLASGSPNRCYPTVVAPLSREQRAAMDAVYAAHRAATTADRATVQAGLEAAKAARAAGKPRTEIQAILDSIKDELERLQAAGEKLRADIDALLTPEQRAANCFGPKTGG